ncbi:ATP-dependent DNA helicase RecQ [Marivirga tractuosa]|uniref:ATP-dependent DNA helicase RecQ n=1 Tax=Marivirga tractuosa (strain ATCC 23168 / DSM 4126 / NBRC 15989 / NCIMB 1408 / VKM B-1430 / H-43) TaxID=643867 RepID=E4TM78_MARTH|nr:ATP-dependent DNA helicase RecQ [Marivirga tractuosa]ADR21354.1 ATP-dependent DNA helicase RecQ [Marivirga tractuosa DSM 4126]BDD14192.1 ATP-dependent DNA helicase RecQ [Marivirga tractuosa]
MQNLKAIDVLQKYWGYEAFRSMQEDIINSVTSGNDTLALLPTGGGKSICFQVPALMSEGLCLVISPLIALMKDQVEQLKRRKIPAAAVYSGMTYREIDILLDNAAHGAYKFLYVSPERLKTELFLERAKKMNLNLLAIDEAHCISQWGYDFRPPYLEIANFRELFPDLPCIALTATATEDVKIDVQEKLNFKNGKLFQKSFARDNLSYSVRKVENKEAKLFEILRKISGTSVIYARNRRRTKEIAEALKKNGFSADFYHAGLSQADRNAKQDAWLKDKTRIIVATNAFGMGIDKPDVRTVIHWELPDNLESYYQEAGRAGRDEKPAFAVALYHPQDFKEMEEKHELAHPEFDFLKKLYQSLANYFKIAIGSGEMQSYNFEIQDFCQHYNYEVYPVFHALKVLEEEGFIQLNEQFFRPSGLHINLDFKDLYAYEIANAKFEKLIKTVLRIYGGDIYQQVIFINELQIAKMAELSPKEVVKQLNYLDKEGVMDYSPKSDSPQLTFLEARHDANKLPLNKKRLEERKKSKYEKLMAVKNYVENDLVCRTLKLLQYFGEYKEEKCGVCDVCINEKKSLHQDKDLEQKVLQILKDSHLNIERLLENIEGYAKEKVISTVRKLDDEGKLKMDKLGMLSLVN